MKWLDKEMYPEILNLCQEILSNGTISKERFNRVSIIESLNIKGRKDKWQEEVLKGNLFQKEEDKVYFQNRATKEFVREYLKNK